VPKAVTLSAFVLLFAGGALLAGAVSAGGQAPDSTTTETTTTVETTTAPGTTAITTTTVQQTTTRRVTVPTSGTTSPSSGTGNGTPAWVWVLIGLLALALIVVIVLLSSRRGGNVPVDERRRLLAGAVGSWAAQGWAIDSQTADSAVLRRGNELMLVSVDPAGRVTTRPLPRGAPDSTAP
jgi:uncharacterized BrkB/YihY/UPF0761 family membrane protein